ncbi:MAG: TRAP transporter small permease [Synergistaceae bacterium]|jgi:TRAP-type C4-dicarboxylate transport system permease small subunit|nr:TRAP transporter small permease [Synergistaceae bacterium]
MRIIKTILRVLDDKFETVAHFIVIVSGVAVCALIFIGAMMRYIIKVDFYGSEEIILFIAFWLYFMGSALAAKKGTHINANMLSLFIRNKKTLNKLDLIKSGLCLIMALMATLWSFNYVAWSWKMGAKSNVFKLPNVIAQIPIFISFVLWDLYLIRDVVRGFAKIRTAEGEGESCS